MLTPKPLKLISGPDRSDRDGDFDAPNNVVDAKQWNLSSSESHQTNDAALEVKAHRVHQRLGFLFENFRHSCIYWSITEMIHRALLIGYMRFFESGSALKLVFATAVSVFFLLLHVNIRPYVSRALNYLQTVYLTLIWLTYQFSFLVQSDTSTNADSAVGRVLLAITTALSIITVMTPFVFGLLLRQHWLSEEWWDFILSRLGGHAPLQFQESDFKVSKGSTDPLFRAGTIRGADDVDTLPGAIEMQSLSVQEPRTPFRPHDQT
jgi:hypothetical protein